MTRKKKYGRRSGSKKLFGLGTKGLIGGLGLMGVLGAAFFSDQIAGMIPMNIPYKNYAVAFGLGGPAGLVAKVGKDAVLGGGISTGSSGTTNGAW